jgi:hypothetical protein
VTVLEVKHLEVLIHFPARNTIVVGSRVFVGLAHVPPKLAGSFLLHSNASGPALKALLFFSLAFPSSLSQHHRLLHHHTHKHAEPSPTTTHNPPFSPRHHHHAG